MEKINDKIGKESIAKKDNRFTQVSNKTNVILNLIMIIMSLASVVPFILVFIISITSESSINKYGYKFIPKEISFSAYKYMFSSGTQLINSYGVTILVTILGAVLGLLFISTFAYAISRKNFAYRKFFTVISLIPMLFNGGMVASYLVNSRLLGLKNSIFALVLPLCMNTFYIIVLRTFFKTSVPDSVIESAKIDGASEIRLFFQIVLPMALPGIATIGLFLTLGYWNDWFNAMMYIEVEKLIPMQYLLMRMQNSIEFMINNASIIANGGSIADLPKESSKMALVVLTTAPIIFAYPFFQKYFVSGLTIGAVKE